MDDGAGIDFTKYKNLVLLFWDFPCKTVKPEMAFKVLDLRLARYLVKEDLLPEEALLVVALSEKYGGGICDGWNG